MCSGSLLTLPGFLPFWWLSKPSSLVELQRLGGRGESPGSCFFFFLVRSAPCDFFFPAPLQTFLVAGCPQGEVAIELASKNPFKKRYVDMMNGERKCALLARVSLLWFWFFHPCHCVRKEAGCFSPSNRGQRLGNCHLPKSLKLNPWWGEKKGARIPGLCLEMTSSSCVANKEE